MLVQDDVTDVLGMAWNENGVTTDFETNGDYTEQFNAIRTAFGESNVITDLTDNTVTFTDAEGNSVLLSFDNENKRFIPIVSAIENGAPNMFLRTLEDGNNYVTFVCDADGKVCWFNNNGNFLLVVNEGIITPTVNAALMNRLVVATDGSTEITNEQSADDDYNKYTNGDYSFITNAIGGVTFGELKPYLKPNPFTNGYGMVVVDPDEMEIAFLADNNYNYCKVDGKPILATGTGWDYGTVESIENHAGNIVKGSIDVSPATLAAESLSFTLNGNSVSVGNWEQLDQFETMNTSL